jgi:aspartate ammonia-lyase
MFQGGAGTSTNMNANEVIANLALRSMGYRMGDYKHCDSHDHVNLSQSTNDAYPTSLHVAMLLSNDRLMREMGLLVKAFASKARGFARVLKMGRTQLQDAVPMTLGQEFTAFAASLGGEVTALQRVSRVLCEVNMGATAIGTGLNAPRGYAQRCVRHLARITRKPITLAVDLIEATQDTQAFVLYSSVLKSAAIKLSKICNDLRLLASGPRAGLSEINLSPDHGPLRAAPRRCGEVNVAGSRTFRICSSVKRRFSRTSSTTPRAVR